MIKQYVTADYEQIAEWYKARGMVPVKRDHIPTLGYIVPQVAAGFIISTDIHLGILEGYISNPVSDKLVRELALVQITECLIARAKKLGFTELIAFTDNKAIPKYCEKFEFKHIGHDQVYCKEI